MSSMHQATIPKIGTLAAAREAKEEARLSSKQQAAGAGKPKNNARRPGAAKADGGDGCGDGGGVTGAST